MTDVSDAPSHVDLAPLIAESKSETIKKSDLDQRQYRWLRLTNQMQVLLISDPECDHAAAAMDVNVGSASDPEEIPGLAHFCEHMLFLGTEKYPKENEYQNYLEEHGGGSNAFTAHENTNYYFVVQKDHLRGAIDRFAQFFLAPLFSDSATYRELNAVDSENNKNLQADNWRLQQISKWAADPRHPWSRFNVGSVETLKDLPARHVKFDLSVGAGGRVGVSATPQFRPKLDLRAALLEFHATHYSSNLMSLCVLGREPLDQLAQCVVPLFAAVPNKSLARPTWPHEPYPPSQLGRHFRVLPVKDFSSLTLSWPLPSIQPQYRSKPFRYVSHVLGHEGEGSLLSLLKEAGWADQLMAGETRSNSDFATFEVTVELTDEGNPHVDEIVCLVFACLSMIHSKPDDETIWDEMRDLGSVGFRFRDSVEPSNAALSLAGAMQLYPPEELMSAPYMYSEWDPDAIRQLLSLLSPSRFNLIHTTKQHDAAELTLAEPWYGTRFAVRPLSQELIGACAKATPALPTAKGKLRWPDPNPFIPTDFTLACDLPSEQDAAAAAAARSTYSGPRGPGPLAVAPRLIREDGLAKLWHKTDSTFRRPKTHLFLDIVVPAVYASPGASSLTRLFFRLVNDELTEFTYPADCAGLGYSLSLATSGLRLTVAGYNHKLPVLLERVLGRLASPQLDEERFGIQRDLQIKEHANFFKGQPASQIRYATHHLLELSRWHLLEYIAFLQSERCTHANLTQFAKTSLLASLHMSVFCHGNTSEAESRRLVDEAARVLGAAPLNLSQLPAPRLLQLPENVEVILRLHPTLYSPSQLKLFNADEPNSAVEVTLQGELDRRPQTLIVELLCHILANPAFEQLRTKEQLGYIVSLGMRHDLGVCGLRVLVQSSYDPVHLDTRIEAFLESVPTLLGDMTDEAFDNHKDALITAKKEAPKTLRDETGVYWHEIAASTYDFHRDAKDVEICSTLTKQMLLDYWHAIFDVSSPRRRKLSAQMFAGSAELPPRQPTGVGGRKVHYVDGFDAAVEYKRTLAAFPCAPRCDQEGNTSSGWS